MGIYTIRIIKGRCKNETERTCYRYEILGMPFTITSGDYYSEAAAIAAAINRINEINVTNIIRQGCEGNNQGKYDHEIIIDDNLVEELLNLFDDKSLELFLELYVELCLQQSLLEQSLKLFLEILWKLFQEQYLGEFLKSQKSQGENWEKLKLDLKSDLNEKFKKESNNQIKRRGR